MFENQTGRGAEIMSREIKFRAWDIHCKHMLDHSDLIDVVDGGGSVIQMILDESIECHLMQYTGLKDRNGVEIYEGDILRCDEGQNWRVLWSFDGAKWVTINGDLIEDLAETFCYDEIIGNIHENPDLLK